MSARAPFGVWSHRQWWVEGPQHHWLCMGGLNVGKPSRASKKRRVGFLLSPRLPSTLATLQAFSWGWMPCTKEGLL